MVAGATLNRDCIYCSASEDKLYEREVMDFTLSDEQRDVYDLVDRVAQEKLRPRAFDWRDTGHPPAENISLLSELGLLGICLPEEYGGGGRPEFEGILAIERIAAACPVTAEFALRVIAGPAGFVVHWGTEEQKQRYIPKAVSGDEIWAVALSEPEAGTALTDLQTRAEIVGDRCVINGSKTFCSAAPFCDRFLVYVRFGPGVEGIGAVIVGRDAPGFTIGKSQRFMSGNQWAELFFESAEIPASDVLFTGDSFKKLMKSYSVERCSAGARLIGICELALSMSTEYVEQRRQFGRPISDFQFVQGMLADSYIAMESARLIMYRAILRSDGGKPSRLDSSAAKIACADAACTVTDAAMQLHGGAGMTQELPLEWLYRCAREIQVASGTRDIHRSMIASEMVGRRFSHRLPSAREALSPHGSAA